MPGTPKKRERARKAGLAASGIPDAQAVPADPSRSHTRAHNAPEHARASAGARVPPIPTTSKAWDHPGPELRATMDAANVERVRAFASQLGAGVTIRIERRAPAWCSGWQEDTELETGSLGELLEYVRDTWGGHKFRVSVIHPATSQPMHTAPLTIGGPPRDQGRLIDRDSWDAAMSGTRPTTSLQAVAHQPTPPAAPAFDVIGLLNTFMSEQRATRDMALEAVKEVAKAGAERQTELLTTFGREFRTDREDRSLRTQLGELQEGISAVEDLKETVAATLPEAPDDDRPGGGIVDSLKAEIGQQVVKKMFETPAPTSTATAPTNGAPQPPTTSAPIPDAAPVPKTPAS